MAKLRDKTVVVTGASSGIGRLTALACVREGAAVTAVARNEEALEEVAREAGEGLSTRALDVRDAAAVELVAEEVAGRHGRLDVWINNAAVQAFGPIEQVPPDVWRRVVETNVFGTYHGVRAAIPWMREQGDGVIINVSSVVGELGVPMMSAYVASKHAIVAISDCARQELRELRDLRVCSVLPGPVDTPFFQHSANYSGRRIQPVTPVIDAHRVTDAVVQCAAKPKRRQVIVGGVPRALLSVDRLAPGVVEKFIARRPGGGHLDGSTAQPSDGNVFEPDRGRTNASGGWGRTAKLHDETSARAVTNGRRGGRTVPLLAAAAMGVAAAGVKAAWPARR